MPSLLSNGTVQQDTIPLVTRLGITWVATTKQRIQMRVKATMGTRILGRDFVQYWPMTAVLRALAFYAFQTRILNTTAYPLDPSQPTMRLIFETTFLHTQISGSLLLPMIRPLHNRLQNPLHNRLDNPLHNPLDNPLHNPWLLL